MAGVTVQIEDSQLTESLKKLHERISDMSVVMGDIGEYLLLSHHDRWKNQISPTGIPWSHLPLSKKYENSATKQKSRGAGKILTLHGYLKDLTYQASQQGLKLGTNKIYGATHQFGDSSRHIPARPFLGISKEDETEIMRIVSDYLKE